MAIMIPEKPYEFDAASQEGILFDSLTSLPDEYYVFHSFQIVKADLSDDGVLGMREIDFLIFHPQKGIICLEAKAGQVQYKQGEWYYASGKEMARGGPFKQAKTYKYSLRESIEKKRGKLYVDNCKYYHAVWFLSITNNQLQSMVLPQDAPKQIIMLKDDIENPLPAIERIYAYNLFSGKNMSLTPVQSKALLTRYLCPEFDIVPPPTWEHDLKKESFNRLLKEQTNILHFLVDQRSAVINGAAGTGKTMIALAKAQMHARSGESVLFLCYNSRLKDSLAQKYAEDNITFFTIDGLACKLCKTSTPDYQKLAEKLLEMDFNNTFPYKHIIIDEGQDFGKLDEKSGNGKKAAAESKIIQELSDLVMGREDESGTFYVFYDKLQLVQAKKIPQYIQEADCKLTLYRNCRNTENIAITSLKPISERKPKLIQGCIAGDLTTVHFCEPDSVAKSLDNVLAALRMDKYDDIVILTAKTLEKSAIFPQIVNEKYQNRYQVATCRTFKGLEADAIILIDVDGSTFEDGNEMLFYVGTSRARLRLEIITSMDEEQCKYTVVNDFGYEGKIKNARRTFATCLNALAAID